jgi:hypothetical protein
VSGVDHLVVLVARPVGRLEQRPDVVEQADGKGAPRRTVELGRSGWLGHDGLLSVDDLGDLVQQPLQAMGPCLDAGAMGGQEAGPLGRVVRPQDGTDLVERHLELA